MITIIDVSTRILIFEMWNGMNKFDHGILALVKQQREKPEWGL